MRQPFERAPHMSDSWRNAAATLATGFALGAAVRHLVGALREQKRQAEVAASGASPLTDKDTVFLKTLINCDTNEERWALSSTDLDGKLPAGLAAWSVTKKRLHGGLSEGPVLPCSRPVLNRLAVHLEDELCKLSCQSDMLPVNQLRCARLCRVDVITIDTGKLCIRVVPTRGMNVASVQSGEIRLGARLAWGYYPTSDPHKACCALTVSQKEQRSRRCVGILREKWILPSA